MTQNTEKEIRDNISGLKVDVVINEKNIAELQDRINKSVVLFQNMYKEIKELRNEVERLKGVNYEIERIDYEI